jgi:DNA-binding transcriptional LysR family regulator
VGVTCVLDVFANRFLADGSLVQVYPDWETTFRTFHVVMPKSRAGSAKVKAFTDFLFEVFDAQRRPDAHAVVGVKALGRR